MAGAKRGRPPKRIAEQKELAKQEEDAPCTSTGAKRVRACAHSSNEADGVGFIVGRSDEWETVSTLAGIALNAGRGAALYLAGTPGSGKTMVMLRLKKLYTGQSSWRRQQPQQSPPLQQQQQQQEEVQQQQQQQRYQHQQFLWINCGVYLSKPEQIFCDIAAALSDENNEAYNSSSRDDVRARLPALVRRRGMLLIVDEADALGVDVAAGVLALGCAAGSKLVVVAAGNALALAEEKLHEKVPHVHAVHLPAYTATQIFAVLVHKFVHDTNTHNTTIHTHTFEPTALQLCAKKVASSWGGDMRKALNACQLARELSNPTTTSSSILVTMCAMAEALSKCVGYACPLMKTVKGLPSELQLALCSVVLQQRRCMKSTLGDVEVAYRTLSRRLGLKPCSPAQFQNTCDLLQTHGLVHLGASRNSKQPKRVTLRISDADVVLAFQGNAVFEQLLTSPPKTSD